MPEQHETPAVIYVHVPKSAGSTMSQLFMQNYSEEELLRIRGPHYAQSVEAFGKQPEAERAKIRMAYGHMSFGLHTMLPGPSMYFTILREPVDRMISHYYYMKEKPNSHLSKSIQARMNTVDCTLQDLLANETLVEFDNYQTRLLAGLPIRVDRPGLEMELPVGGCDDALLAQAKKNIEDHFVMVGLQEHFDASVLLASELFGWGAIRYFSTNVRPGRVSMREPVSDEMRALLRERNSYDMALYAYAKERFDAVIAEKGPAFQTKLKRYRQRNALYSWWNRKARYVYRLLRYGKTDQYI